MHCIQEARAIAAVERLARASDKAAICHSTKMHHWSSLLLLARVAAAGLASELWRENSATAQQSLWDPFVLGLGAGT